MQPLRPRFTRRLSSAFSGRAFPDDVIALAVRWYVRYRLSYVEVCEWLAERGILVDQSTIYRWVQRFAPLFDEVARKYRDPVGPDWRVDETYARIRGRLHYIYRAIDGRVQIVDTYVSPHGTSLPPRGSSSERSPLRGSSLVGSSLTKPPPTRQPSRSRCPATSDRAVSHERHRA
jgi:hypothetical protein